MVHMQISSRTAEMQVRDYGLTAEGIADLARVLSRQDLTSSDAQCEVLEIKFRV